ncbi:hypothetical protein J4H86_18540 [Spiractinospora alimapuensis]|uniref:DUF6745 domain-containing protein n=1 Tax=Spiractinospora alimapuensis TaxID=2820884 RepID=UPI001F2F4413|nr:hypothetical protein [Spiractinospora alimapuensis]QVQ50848.1 hypothetical protein J4H86_18540 [Spiractinospora alimapuensis]
MSPQSPQQAAQEIRDEWVRWALCTEPADRVTAKAAIEAIYASVGAKPPRIHWVDSPRGLLHLDVDIPAPPPLRYAPERMCGSDWATPNRVADRMFALRHRLDARTGQSLVPAWGRRQGGPRSATESAAEAAARSVQRVVHDAVKAPLRTAFTTLVGAGEGVSFAGQHEAPWLARIDLWRRLGLLTLNRADAEELAPWIALARSCGWWWPRENFCVVAERPTAIRHEVVPPAEQGDIRLHDTDHPAVEYRDGWGIHVVHGTLVPAWVLQEPTVERIAAERNVEVRRTAIERVGWPTYISQAGLCRVAVAPDPGNPGAELQLYDVPPDARFPPSRLLLVRNGSLERDGRRRNYGISVPDGIDDPLAAAGWTYGLTGSQYARLVRRT